VIFGFYIRKIRNIKPILSPKSNLVVMLINNYEEKTQEKAIAPYPIIKSDRRV